MTDPNRLAEAQALADVEPAIDDLAPEPTGNGHGGDNEVEALRQQLRQAKLTVGQYRARAEKYKAEAQSAKATIQSIAPSPAKAAPAGRSELARMFPTTDEQIKIYHREDGQMVWRGQFSTQDLRGASTIEAFLAMHLVPKYGPGEYLVSLIADNGAVKRESIFNIGGDPGGPAPAKATTLEGIAAELLREYAKRQVEVPVVPPAPSAASPLDAKIERLERLIEAQARGQSDPSNVVLAKLLEKLDRQDHAPPPMPMMPPAPPPVDVASVVRETAMQLATLLKPEPAPVAQPPMTPHDMIALAERLRPPPEPKEDVLSQLGKLAQLKTSLFGDSAEVVTRQREQIEFLKEQFSDLKQALQQQPDVLDEMRRLREVTEMAKALAGGNSADSFGATIRGIFDGIPDAAREIGNAVDKVREREVARRVAGIGAAKPQPKPQPQSQPTAQSQSQPAPKPKPTPYPPGFRPYFDAMVAAATDADRIKTSLAAFQFLARDGRWKPYFDATLELARARDRKAIQYVRALMDNFAKAGMPAEQISAVASAYENNWDDLVDRLFGAVKKEDA